MSNCLENFRRAWLVQGRTTGLYLIAAACMAWTGMLSTSAAAELNELEQQAMVAAVDRVANSVVSIETIGGLERVDKVLIGTGPSTGLIVSPDGYIVSSAFNFAQKPSSILVGLPDGTRTPAQLVATDRSRMLVLLKVNVEDKLAVPEIAPESELRVGQWSIAIGRTFDAARPNMSVGIISALHRIWNKAVQTDAKVSPSNYGGPLVDIRGRVIGVLVPLSAEATGDMAGVEWYDSGIGFAIPSEHIMKVLPRMKEGRDLLPGIMGINLAKGDMYGEPPVIASSRPNSPAYKAGLRAGDKIVEIEGQPIGQRIDLTREVQQRYAGDTIRVAVMRGEERLEKSLELTSKLDPYARPFLGILARRDVVEKPAGLTVRYVYPDSPAVKAGLKPEDIITRADDKPVLDRDGLINQLAFAEVGQTIKLEVTRGREKLSLTATLGREPETVPTELPPARTFTPAVKGERPEVGVLELKVPEYENNCLAYVPEDYNPQLAYGVLVWLHGRGGYKDEALLERWQDFCDKNDFILLAPKSASSARWSQDEVQFVIKLLDQISDDYHIDPMRVAVQGHQGGGAIAYTIAFGKRDKIRGVAGIQAPFAVRPPENDPEYRLSFFVTNSKDNDVTQQLKGLRDMKYAVTEKQQGAKGRYLSNEELAEFLRWFDSLDKI